jgi:hypothetical protein
MIMAAALAAALSAAPGGAAAGDRHAGYYYPKPVSTEVYKSRARELPKIDRKVRI